jgi:putative transposase
MPYDPERHHRRSIRLATYDYARAGAYFVTIVTQGRQCIFGEVVNGEMKLNDAGRIARDCWMAVPNHFGLCTVDAYVVMPNHVHGIVVIGAGVQAEAPHVGATHASPLRRGPGHHSLGAIVGSFKSAASRSINRLDPTRGASAVWQRNYFEHVIRDERSLQRIRDYIAANPARWADDPENPDVVWSTTVGATHASPARKDPRFPA